MLTSLFWVTKGLSIQYMDELVKDGNCVEGLTLLLHKLQYESRIKMFMFWVLIVFRML